MSCLKEVMKDYRSEVQDVLSADRQLANEIEFDLKRFEEQQKESEEQRRKQNTPNNSPQVWTFFITTCVNFACSLLSQVVSDAQFLPKLYSIMN